MTRWSTTWRAAELRVGGRIGRNATITLTPLTASLAIMKYVTRPIQSAAVKYIDDVDIADILGSLYRLLISTKAISTPFIVPQFTQRYQRYSLTYLSVKISCAKTKVNERDSYDSKKSQCHFLSSISSSEVFFSFSNGVLTM